MNYRFILMPPAWSGMKEHVVRPLNGDHKGNVPWVALARAEGGKLDFVPRAQVSRQEIKKLAAEARAWHESRKIKWEVAAKTWGFFGLFSKPRQLAATGDVDTNGVGVRKFRYGVTMDLAGTIVPDDLAPEILFTTSAVEEAYKLLQSTVVIFALPKRGWLHATGLDPFVLPNYAKGMREVYDRAGKAAVSPDLFQVYLNGRKRQFTLTRPADGVAILLNAHDDDDAQFAEAW